MDLEELRKDGLDSVTATNVCMTPQEVIELCGDLHASWLFHPDGLPALQSLCQSLSSVAPDISGSWKHVGGILNISWIKLQCIDHAKYERDKSELCLMTYAQSSYSTLGDIMKALETVKRLDALATVGPSIIKLVDKVKSNRGYQSLLQTTEEKTKLHNIVNTSCEKSGGNTFLDKTEIHALIRPKGYEKLLQNLPWALRNLDPIVNESKIVTKVCNPRKEDACYQGSAPIPVKDVPYRKVVFLTFSEDGEEAAHRIAQVLRNPKTDRLPFGVLIMDENADKLHANPELIISTLFQQVDYVMPIITKGYLESLKGQTNGNYSKDMFSSMDASYVQYIYDLMTKYYVGNSCKNDKCRCVVVGDNETKLKALVNNPLFSNEPTLKAWVYESDLEKLAQRLALSKSPNKQI